MLGDIVGAKDGDSVVGDTDGENVGSTVINDGSGSIDTRTSASSSA